MADEIVVHLPEAQRVAFKREAAKRGVSVSDLLALLVERELQHAGQREQLLDFLGDAASMSAEERDALLRELAGDK